MEDPVTEFGFLEFDDIEIAFGTTKWLPVYEDLPDDFRGYNRDRSNWVRVVEMIFFEGCDDIKVFPKAGIDPDSIFVFMNSHLRSFEPKLEHKIAGVAFRLSQILDGIIVTGSGTGKVRSAGKIGLVRRAVVNLKSKLSQSHR